MTAHTDGPTPERGITVGKSWPRPATPCALVPRWEGEFRDHADWVTFASKRLTVAYDSNGRDLTAICVDTLGRRCANGRDMKRAQDEGAFPVRYFWDCEPAAADLRADAAQDVLAALEALRNHCSGKPNPSTLLALLANADIAIAKAKGLPQ